MGMERWVLLVCVCLCVYGQAGSWASAKGSMALALQGKVKAKAIAQVWKCLNACCAHGMKVVTNIPTFLEYLAALSHFVILTSA